ncbi:MAG: DUF3071 domain-containing protein [Actinobacteria bacterium]|nr:DUF3071 domain-containing protein [Actinomycetota bacterium]
MERRWRFGFLLALCSPQSRQHCRTSQLIEPPSVTLALVTDLRFTGKTPDGVHVTLADSDGNEFTLRISDTLRASVNQQRLSSVPDESEEFLSVKDIQRRLRHGESAQDIARESGTSIEKIERFSSPIVQERSFIIDKAHAVIVRREPGQDPITLFDAVISRLAPRNISQEDLAWNAWRHPDGTWSLSLSYPNSDGHGDAIWEFDPTRRSVVAQDENARWMMGDAQGVSKIAERARSESGLIYTDEQAPAPIRITSAPEPIKNEPPRLVALREEPDESSARDGVVGRAKVPSWDEIMFGAGAVKKDDEDEFN